LVDIFRHDRRVLPRGDVGDAAGRNTDQDGDLPVWIVLPPGGTAHSQGDCEAAADQGMPNHGSLSANETLVGNCGSAWTCKELALSPPRCLAPQSTGLAPEALITLAQSGASDSMAAANCAGEVPIGTMPSSSKRLRTSGSARMRTASRWSLAMIGSGVPAGASSPNQAVASKPGKPASTMVGRSGDDGGSAETGLANTMVRRPPSRAGITAAMPR